MGLKNIFKMTKTDRYTQDGRDELAKLQETEDVKYKTGDISQKTGLQKQPDGSWAPPKSNGVIAQQKQKMESEKYEAARRDAQAPSKKTEVNTPGLRKDVQEAIKRSSPEEIKVYIKELRTPGSRMSRYFDNPDLLANVYEDELNKITESKPSDKYKDLPGAQKKDALYASTFEGSSIGMTQTSMERNGWDLVQADDDVNVYAKPDGSKVTMKHDGKKITSSEYEAPGSKPDAAEARDKIGEEIKGNLEAAKYYFDKANSFSPTDPSYKTYMAKAKQYNDEAKAQADDYGFEFEEMHNSGITNAVNKYAEEQSKPKTYTSKEGRRNFRAALEDNPKDAYDFSKTVEHSIPMSAGDKEQLANIKSFMQDENTDYKDAIKSVATGLVNGNQMRGDWYPEKEQSVLKIAKSVGLEKELMNYIKANHKGYEFGYSEDSAPRELTGDCKIKIRQTQDVKYKTGDISQKTGLQKQPDGSWAPPKKGGKPAGKNGPSRMEKEEAIRKDLGLRGENDLDSFSDEQIEMMYQKSQRTPEQQKADFNNSKIGQAVNKGRQEFAAEKARQKELASKTNAIGLPKESKSAGSTETKQEYKGPTNPDHDEILQKMKSAEGYGHVKNIGDYEVYRVTSGPEKGKYKVSLKGSNEEMTMSENQAAKYLLNQKRLNERSSQTGSKPAEAPVEKFDIEKWKTGPKVKNNAKLDWSHGVVGESIPVQGKSAEEKRNLINKYNSVGRLSRIGTKKNSYYNNKYGTFEVAGMDNDNVYIQEERRNGLGSTYMALVTIPLNEVEEINPFHDYGKRNPETGEESPTRPPLPEDAAPRQLTGDTKIRVKK